MRGVPDPVEILREVLAHLLAGDDLDLGMLDIDHLIGHAGREQIGITFQVSLTVTRMNCQKRLGVLF